MDLNSLTDDVHVVGSIPNHIYELAQVLGARLRLDIREELQSLLGESLKIKRYGTNSTADNSVDTGQERSVGTQTVLGSTEDHAHIHPSIRTSNRTCFDGVAVVTDPSRRPMLQYSIPTSLDRAIVMKSRAIEYDESAEYLEPVFEDPAFSDSPMLSDNEERTLFRFSRSFDAQSPRTYEALTSLSNQECLDVISNILKDAVASFAMEVSVSILILLNAVVIGLECEFDIKHFEKPKYFVWLERLSTTAFTAELIMKLGAFRLEFVLGPEMSWNLFDAVLVLQMLMDQAGITSQNFSMMRILRILRITRLARILRFVTELRTIVLSMASAIRSMFWCLLLLFMLIYGATILIAELVHSTPATSGSALSNDLQHFFGSVPRTGLTLFECVTGGMDWDRIVWPLFTESNPAAGMLLCFYICFVTFAMLNVITGVVLDTAQKYALSEESRLTATTICTAFDIIDDDYREIRLDEFLQSVNTHAELFESLDIDVSEASSLFELIDEDHSGGLNTNELLRALMRFRTPAKSLDFGLRTLELRQLGQQQAEKLDLIMAMLGPGQAETYKLKDQAITYPRITKMEELGQEGHL